MLGPAQESLLGIQLGHYRIVEKIGAGGMGDVYRAHDKHLDREVAIKVLPPGSLNAEGARQRFRKEALAISKLNHPNIATIHHFDTEGDLDYMVMEYVPGKTLREKITERSLFAAEITSLATQIAEGLVAAHERGIVHRDLKPENVRLTLEGRVKILDFGLAKVIQCPLDSGSTTGTHLSAIAGTMPYMAPEQLLSGFADQSADLFSFGVVLYEMATGTLPFRGDTPNAISDAILHTPPIPPLRLNPDLPPNLETIILKALEKDRDLRFHNACDMLIDLRRLARSASGAHESAPPASEPTRYYPAGRSRRIWGGAAAVILLGLLSGGLWVREANRPPQPGPAAAYPSGVPSIAVLPFTDMSSGKDQEYFSDGLTEELLNNLSKIEGLKVAGRTSSFQFRGKNEDLRVIGQKLNVATILEGSVRREGKRTRITAQLISANDGFHLWSETYERQIGDIFAIEDEIARAVAEALKLKLLTQGRHSSHAKNYEAYTAYLQGRYFYERRGKENVAKAIAYYEQAIKLEPDYPPAWVGLAVARSRQADGSYVPIEEGSRKAREAAERALALDPNLAEAHAAMGWIKMTYDRDWAGADAFYQRALALEPRNSQVVRGASTLATALGRFDEAWALSRQVVELDPLSVVGYFNLGATGYFAGRLEEAVGPIKKTLELNPNFPVAHSLLGRVYLAQGHPQEALAEIEREQETLWRLQGRALVYHVLGRRKESDAALADVAAKYHAEAAFQVAEVYAFRGQAEQALQWLDRAYTQHDAGLSNMKGNPLLKNLEHDPRYIAFLKKIRLAD